MGPELEEERGRRECAVAHWARATIEIFISSFLADFWNFVERRFVLAAVRAG